jgi:cytosine/adenosine deaminase-related metal-dependent hydrolase
MIRNVRLPDRPPDEVWDIGAGDKIVAIDRGLAGAADSYDAGGRLVCAGLIETHPHLDKSRIIDRCPLEAAREISPMRQVTALKPSFTEEDVRSRAERTLVECILNGATRMRAQVEVDPAIGIRGFDAVQSLIADCSWAIDIEICVFPQDGLTNYPGTDKLLVEGLKRGAKVIGGARATTPTLPAGSTASSSLGIAEPGGICLSEDGFRQVREVDAEFDEIGEQSLKNIARPLHVYRMPPHESEVSGYLLVKRHGRKFARLPAGAKGIRTCMALRAPKQLPWAGAGTLDVMDDRECAFSFSGDRLIRT